jgi:hypothetical protein
MVRPAPRAESCAISECLLRLQRPRDKVPSRDQYRLNVITSIGEATRTVKLLPYRHLSGFLSAIFLKKLLIW